MMSLKEKNTLKIIQTITPCFTVILTLLFSTILFSNVSAASLGVIATMNNGVNPAGIAITPDGKTAYVANNNNYGIAGQDTVTVLDLKNNRVKGTISDDSFMQPFSVTINPQGTRAYVTNSDGATVSVIDTGSNEVVGVIDGFDGPSGMVITSNGLIGYVTNYGGPDGLGSGNGHTVNVVDLIAQEVIGAPISVGLAPASVAISPDDQYVYTINYVDGNPDTGTMSVIQGSIQLVVNTISGFFGPFSLAISPSGKYAYVTNFGSNNFEPFGTTVSVVNLKKNVISDSISLAIQPAGIAITPNGRYACVTNYNSLYDGESLVPGEGSVNIIDLKKNTLLKTTIAVGQSPANIAISPDGKYAYVTNYTSNTTQVIDLRSLKRK